MLEEIKRNLNERISVQPDARFTSDDEIRLAWCIREIEYLRENITAVENCLIRAVITNPMELTAEKKGT